MPLVCCMPQTMHNSLLFGRPGFTMEEDGEKGTELERVSDSWKFAHAHCMHNRSSTQFQV